MADQDWKPVVWTKDASKNSDGTPKNHGNGVPNKMKRLLNDENTDLHIEKVDHSLSLQIQQARQAKKRPDGKAWTQKDLSTALSIDVKTIQDYESGKAQPNGQLISKISRALGVKLVNTKKHVRTGDD
jgi:ribosome-binding protein aMBF1 (putative translation factor)